VTPPVQVASFIQAKESLKRLKDFFKLEDLQVNLASAPTQRTQSSFSKRGTTLDSPPEVRIKNGYFSWGSNSTGGNEAVLRAINATFPSGKLTAIVGKVGCGKSSLLSALLGEMIMTNGSVHLGCAVALASQEPWIQNATVRDNILFGCPMDSVRYAEVLRVCALQADLDILPAGDMTEIGEKGINLSGGQKQRINVARAVYCGGDVYMFDDPLSAVDSHVGAHMFSACFQQHLEGTTRILVTHKIEILERVDHIICMTDEGSIRCTGSYTEISSKHPEIFTHILTTEPNQQRPSDAAIDATPSQSKKGPAAAPVTAANASGALTSAEGRAQGAVKGEVYKFYALAMGRKYLIAVILVGALAQVKSSPHCMHVHGVFHFSTDLSSQTSRVIPDWWLSHWVSNVQELNDWRFYITVFGVLVAVSGVLICIRDAILAFAELKASSALHNRMLESLFRAPVSFFDTTPVGRIINRFSADQDTLDVALPRNLNSLYNCVCTVLSTVITIVAITWPFVVVLIPLTYVFNKVQTLTPNPSSNHQPPTHSP